jgi:membrane-bound lytic murein transglycosylase D
MKISFLCKTSYKECYKGGSTHLQKNYLIIQPYKILKTSHFIIIYSLIGILSGILIYHLLQQDQQTVSTVVVTDSAGQSYEVIVPDSKVRIFELPDHLEFAGEKVPLDNPEIMERFEREVYVNAYWQSNMILLMKRSAKYLKLIEKILAEHNVPDDFKYLAMAESGLLNVVSSAGAMGFWQFMPETAKEYKLLVNDQVDERYHLEKSTIAACEYLKKAYARFGNWTSVAASYNMGISGLKKRSEEQQRMNYYELYLNEETSRYIFRILAFKVIFEDPEKYGYELKETEYYKLPLYRELKVDQSIPNLTVWALKHNSNYKDLKIHNPWLRSAKLEIKAGQDFTIKLPLN